MLLNAERHRDAANRIGSTIFASRRPFFYWKKSSIARDERPQSPPATLVNDHDRNVRFGRQRTWRHKCLPPPCAKTGREQMQQG
jgi:hypothetical protein